ncbi:hypothetical protein BGZ76_003762 [Entomortierella beljakovae]|nr:hypothetical protein BGZ76_003762 [Entomortierella beljakovae]
MSTCTRARKQSATSAAHVEDEYMSEVEEEVEQEVANGQVASKLALYEKVVHDIQDLNQRIKRLEDINSDGSELSSKTTDTVPSKYGALKVTSDFPEVSAGDEPRIFLDNLRHKAIAYVRPETFEKLATRYLSYHIESE